jgi:Zn-dependent peptidase ImmA (M78 family)
MKLDVHDHPGYPFRPEFLKAFATRPLAFVDGPEPGSPEHVLLAEFLGLVHAFAFLERIIQGEVICELPVHVDRGLIAVLDPEEEGEVLAAREAALLDWTPESADSVVDALDDIGVKVICRDDPEVGPGWPGARLGAFTFEGDAGPAVLVGASPHTPEAAFIAAHEFGHFTADIDPYRPRLCRWGARTFANLSDRPEEARADRFARALLMPREAFRDALQELGEGPEEGADPRAEQLATLFGVPQATVHQRLIDLDLPPVGFAESDFGLADAPAEAPAAAPARGRRRKAAEEVKAEGDDAATPGEEAGTAVDAAGEPRPDVALTLPERFVNLALAAYAGRVLEIDELAHFLRVPLHEALEVAEVAGVTPEWREDGE